MYLQGHRNVYALVAIFNVQDYNYCSFASLGDTEAHLPYYHPGITRTGQIFPIKEILYNITSKF